MRPGLQVRAIACKILVLLPVISMSQFQGSRLWVRGQRLCWISSWAVLKKPFWPFWPMMKKPGDLQVTQQSRWLYHKQFLSARNSFGKNSLSGAWLPVPPHPSARTIWSMLMAGTSWSTSVPRGWRPRCPSVLLELGLDVLSI